MKLSIDCLHECLSLEDGTLRWRVRPESHFNTKAAWKCHCSRNAGKVAGCVHRGHRRIEIFGETYAATHCAWALHHGTWPDGEIVFLDGDSLNLRPENLKMVSAPERRLHRRDFHRKGVRQEGSRFRARFRNESIGTFATRNEAQAAHDAAVQAWLQNLEGQIHAGQ